MVVVVAAVIKWHKSNVHQQHVKCSVPRKTIVYFTNDVCVAQCKTTILQ